MEMWTWYLNSELAGVIKPDSEKVPILFIHGLNQNPSSMYELMKEFMNLNYDPYLLHLAGHQTVDSFSVSSQDWISSYQRAVSFLQKNYKSRPVVFGFSMGALLALHQIDFFSPSSMILLAPAHRPRFYSFFLKPLLPRIKKVPSLFLGSTWNVHYRFHKGGVPSQIYKAFFEILDQFHKQELDPQFDNCLREQRILLFSIPGDELVSHQQLKRWCRLGPAQWKFETLEKDFKAPIKMKHIAVDRQSLGESVFQSMIQRIEQYLGKQ